jgi:hypothetical protein
MGYDQFTLMRQLAGINEGELVLPLNCSGIKYAGYSPMFREMSVGFVRGGEENYTAVPVAVFLGLMVAKSAGRYYNEVIRGRFPPVEGGRALEVARAALERE